MKNHKPFASRRIFLTPKNPGRARVKLAVLFVLALHGVALVALLLQGCRQETTSDTVTATNQPPPFIASSNAAPAAETNLAQAAVATNSTPAPVVETNQPVAAIVETAAPTNIEYKVVKGDNLSTIAKKAHISVKALMEANPGVEPMQLQIGQVLRLPAPATTNALAALSSTAAIAATVEGVVAEQTYVVKSGDTLTKIAAQFHIPIKALRAANDLKTDRIKVGQKLRIPANSLLAPGAGAVTNSLSAPAPTPTAQ